MDGTERVLLAGLGGEFIASSVAADCDIYRGVVGVFDGGATNPRLCHPLEKPDLLRNFKYAAQISVGDSAEPLLKKGDLVLLGLKIPPPTRCSVRRRILFSRCNSAMAAW